MSLTERRITRSPPITLGAGTEGFTEDYAVVELDSSKIQKAFAGNVIDLGTKIPFRQVHIEDVPPLRPLSIQIRSTTTGESCLLVIKNGNATGITIGRATGIFSYVREFLNNNTHQTSMEWAILPYDNKSGVFSAPDDSGSIIANGLGRIGGLLAGGAGKTGSSDITYATPFFWLFLRIKENGYPNAHLYPVMA